MNALTIALFACLVVLATAAPSIVGPAGVVVGPAGAIVSAGAAGIVAPGLLGARIGLGAWDDGQWRGEGLVESQDWAGRTAAALGAHGLGAWGAHGLGAWGRRW